MQTIVELARLNWMNGTLKKLASGIVFIAVGTTFALYVLGIRVLNPVDTSWLADDPATGYLGWEFFRREEHLSFPIGWASALGYPLGEPIAYLDSLPLAALFFWPMRHVLPTNFQYYGLWFTLASVLQLYFGYRISYRLTLGDRMAAMGGALLFMTAPPFIWRAFGHYALTSHWLILAAIDFYLVASMQFSPKRATLAVLICFCAGGVNPYITAMVLLVLTGAFLKPLVSPPVESSQTFAFRALIFAFGVSISIIAAASSLLAFGFLRPDDPDAYSGSGYGFHSMNLLAPIDPQNFPALLLKTQSTFAGQFEGYNYLGLGLILLGLFALVRNPKVSKTLFLRDTLAGWFIFLSSLLLALSLKITVGNSLLFELHVPDAILKTLSAFRSSGRLFWPAFYLIVSSIIAASFLTFGRRTALFLFFAFLVQLADLRSLQSATRAYFERGSSGVLTDDPPWQELGRKHQHLVVIPAWQCDVETSPGGNVGYWIFGKLAAQHKMTINSFYAGRVSPKQRDYFCSQQPNDIFKRGLDANTAYVFSTNRLALLAQPNGHYCRKVNKVVLCSMVDGKEGIDETLFDALPITPLDTLISFKSGDGQADSLIGDGWTGPEPWGRWSSSTEASIIVRFSNNSKSEYVDLALLPYVPPNHKQRLEVMANGRHVGDWSFVEGSTGNIRVFIPSEVMSANGVVVLKFKLPDAVSPKVLGLSADSRDLAVGLITLRLSSAL